jgi:hypothetical protein
MNRSRSAIAALVIVSAIACREETPLDIDGDGPMCPAASGSTTSCVDGECDPLASESGIADVLGCWELITAIGSRESTMVVGPSGLGEARLYFYTGRTLWFADFDVRATNVTPASTPDEDETATDTDGSETSTTGEPSPPDPVAAATDRLLCSPGPPWTSFPFVWKQGLG